MRHTVTAAATVLLFTLGATACGTNDGSKADHKPTPSGTPSPTTSAQREGQYVAATQDIAFTTRRPSNDELLAYPPKWCKALADGHSVAWMFSSGGGDLYPIGLDWGTVEKNADRLLIAGVKAYCPQHLGAVTSELRDSGKY